MSEISLDRTLWSGFSLARRNPGAFSLWVAVNLLLGLGPAALVMALLGPNFLDVLRHEGGEDQAAGLLRVGGAAQGLSLVTGLVLYAMLYAAIFRAVLQPEKRRFGYLRLGPDEALMGLLIAMFYVGFIAVLAVAIFVSVLITAGVSLATPVAGALVGALLTLGLIGGFIWLAARLSMVMPMTFQQRRIDLAEAWALTRGHTKRLLLMAFLLALVGLAMGVLLFAILGAGITAFVGSFGDAAAMKAFFEQPTEAVIRDLTPWGLAAAALSAMITTLGFVVFAAPWAEAYRQIVDDERRTEDVFG